MPGAVAALSQRIGARGSLPIRLNVGLLQQLGKSSDVWVSYSGAAADVFLHVLFFVLLHGSRERILRCPCGKLFYRVGRRKCCRRECTNKSCWERYSKTRKGRRAITKARKKVYSKHNWTYGARKEKRGGLAAFETIQSGVCNAVQHFPLQAGSAWYKSWVSLTGRPKTTQQGVAVYKFW